MTPANEQHRLDDLVQGLTAILWALEAGAHEQAHEAARSTLERAQTLIGDRLASEDVAPGTLRLGYKP